MTDTALIIAVSLIVVCVFAVATMWWLSAQKRAALKAQFGPEYDRTVSTAGRTRTAEADLSERARRVKGYHLRPLTPDRSRYFTDAWRRLQALFVDNPAAAVADADGLVTDLMAERGYPMAEFDRRADDLSVDHGTVVQHYRDAHAIAERQASRSATTEDLRQAVIHYRALFEDLLEIGEPQTVRA